MPTFQNPSRKQNSDSRHLGVWNLNDLATKAKVAVKGENAHLLPQGRGRERYWSKGQKPPLKEVCLGGKSQLLVFKSSQDPKPTVLPPSHHTDPGPLHSPVDSQHDAADGLEPTREHHLASIFCHPAPEHPVFPSLPPGGGLNLTSCCEVWCDPSCGFWGSVDTRALSFVVDVPTHRDYCHPSSVWIC